MEKKLQIIENVTPPQNRETLWLDSSAEPKVLKYFTPYGTWEAVTGSGSSSSSSNKKQITQADLDNLRQTIVRQIPSKVSQLSNDRNYITANQVPQPDLSMYAKTQDITQLVQALVQQQLSGYLKASEVDESLIKTEMSLTIDTLESGIQSITAVSGSASWIKGRRCLAKPIASGVAICYLSEYNSEYYHDDVTPALLDGTEGYWMTELPEYWWQAISVGDSFMYNTSLTNTLPHHSGKTLVGVVPSNTRRIVLASGLRQPYSSSATSTSDKATSQKYANSSQKIYRSSSSTQYTATQGEPIAPMTYISKSRAQSLAKNISSGWDIISYETYKKIAWLSFLKYKTFNLSSVLGEGNVSNYTTLGNTSSLGNKDGKVSNGNTNLLGIENWYKGIMEVVDLGSMTVNTATAPYETTYTKVPGALGVSNFTSSYQYRYPSKFILGEYADLLPLEFTDSSNAIGAYWYNSTGYSNPTSAELHKGTTGGLLDVDLSSSGTIFSSEGFRLQYTGNITVIDDPAQFKAITMI